MGGRKSGSTAIFAVYAEQGTDVDESGATLEEAMGMHQKGAHRQ